MIFYIIGMVAGVMLFGKPELIKSFLPKYSQWIDVGVTWYGESEYLVQMRINLKTHKKTFREVQIHSKHLKFDALYKNIMKDNVE